MIAMRDWGAEHMHVKCNDIKSARVRYKKMFHLSAIAKFF